MAFPSVTNTFTNGSTADATQVNQNFTDIINGITDTTKDISINAITTAGNCTFNNNVILGSSSSKTITVNGSIITSVPVNANNSYDLGGSTLGWASIYLGSAGGFTTRVVGGATASWTMTLPVNVPAANNYVLQSTTGGVCSWTPQARGPEAAQNFGISTTVGANAMTINLTDATGATPSATSPVTIAFRSATAATGTVTYVNVTGALSVVVSSGATLGHTSAIDQYIYLWAVNNSGTVELAVSGSRFDFDEGSIQTTTAMSGSATDWKTMYATVGRAGVPVRLIGRIKSNQATAGTYASNSTEITPATQGTATWATQSGWQTYTPTFTGLGTVTAITFVYRRVFNSYQIQGVWTNGTVTAVLAAISLPNSFTSGSEIGTNQVIGLMVLNSNSAGAFNVLVSPSSTTMNLAYSGSGGGGIVPQNGTTFGTGLLLSAQMELPIKELRSY